MAIRFKWVKQRPSDSIRPTINRHWAFESSICLLRISSTDWSRRISPGRNSRPMLVFNSTISIGSRVNVRPMFSRVVIVATPWRSTTVFNCMIYDSTVHICWPSNPFSPLDGRTIRFKCRSTSVRVKRSRSSERFDRRVRRRSRRASVRPRWIFSFDEINRVSIFLGKVFPSRVSVCSSFSLVAQRSVPRLISCQCRSITHRTAAQSSRTDVCRTFPGKIETFLCSHSSPLLVLRRDKRITSSPTFNHRPVGIWMWHWLFAMDRSFEKNKQCSSTIIDPVVMLSSIFCLRQRDRRDWTLFFSFFFSSSSDNPRASCSPSEPVSWTLYKTISFSVF